MKNNEFTCTRCGRVHFGLTMHDVLYQVKRYGTVEDEYDILIEDYKRCFGCGNSYKNFRPAKETDCPVGATLTPILVEE